MDCNYTSKQVITDTLQEYYNACNKLLKIFCDKHEFDYKDAKESWVAEDIGGIACCGDYFFNMDVIVTELKEGPHEDELIKWYDYTMRCSYLGISSCNYSSWLDGCHTISEEEFTKMEEAKKRAVDAEMEFRKLVEEYK